MDAEVLPRRWSTLRPHPVQQAYFNSTHRFITLPAGRRSGKTELAKRRLVLRALGATTKWPPRFFAGAPTRDQAKRIFWDDLKALVPRYALAAKPSESDLMLALINGAQLWVIGMDEPRRIEGQPWDGGVLDEYADMKETAWPQNVRPALSDRNGWCDLIGVPEGRNHYYRLVRDAIAMQAKYGAASEWANYTWPSADILPAKEIEAAKRDLDPLTFDQEYNASFVNFTGRAYYAFTEALHAATSIRSLYDDRATLVFCFDFNVEPGTAVIAQEYQFSNGEPFTGIIGEVWIPRNSNTPAVCRRLVQDWGDHKGYIACYGDATGGARGTAKLSGNDWDIIRGELGAAFGDRVYFNVKSSNPSERSRINAMNSRLLSTTGAVHMLIDPEGAPHVIDDLLGVSLLEGGSGEIDKKKTPKLTHLSDALGYYVEAEFPVRERGVVETPIGGI